LESGQTRIAFDRVDIGSLIERATERFRGVAQNNGLLLSSAAPDALAVLGDDNRLLQILSNLLSNAIRHTPPGGLISVTAEADAGTVRIRVHDTGEGIPAERLPAIFNRFERGETSVPGDRGGFGLGLAIVRELVNLHHGSIEVTSELGRATTFTVTLPAAP
jgi:signal transduction histidine kinase